MQITLKLRETLTGVVTVKTNPVDVGDNSLIAAMLVVYAISGTTPVLTIQYETSNDLETWIDLGGPWLQSAAGANTQAYLASSGQLQRYVRASIALTGTGPLASYSLWMNLFPSS